jgi:hypothetical protein
VSIYVPADLKRRMDKTKEAVNWSSLACAAFEMKLGEIAAKKKEKDMEDVIQRLRAAALEEGAEAYSAGVAQGQAWARDFAKPSQLKRLSSQMRDFGDDWDRYMEGESDYTEAELLAFDILGNLEDGHDRADAAAFWRESLGADSAEQVADDEFLRGFVEGSLDIWRQVQRRL